MRLRQIQIFLLLFLFSSALMAQNSGIYYETLDINQVNARLYNGADMFWDLTSDAKYEVPANSGLNSAFASSIWIGGLDQTGNLHTAAQTYRQSGNDFFIGPYRTTGNYMDGLSHSPAVNPIQVVGLSSNKVVYVGTTAMEILDIATMGVQTYSYGNSRLYARVLELANGNILLYGDGSPTSQLPLLEIDPTTLTITPAGSLNQWQGLSATEILNNGQILFAGILGCEVYDPTTQTSTNIASMNTPRIRSASILLPNGNVLLTGGTTTINGANGLTSTEIYDPNANTWAVGPTMAAGRADHNMITMTNGEVLIVGGNTSSGLVDHFDPNTATISTPANLQYTFRGSVLANQPNGDVLISGKAQNGPNIPVFSYTPGQSIVSQSNTTSPLGIGAQLPSGNVFLGFTDGSFQEIDATSMLPANTRWQRIWKVNRSEVDQFIQDFANNSVNFANYPVIQDWPAHGDVSKGEDYYQAPFVDIDMDGVYDPAGDGDYPCIEGDQALWWTFNDDGVHTETSGDEFGLQIKTMAYGYDCPGACPTPWLDHTTFYNYTIQNKSGNVYSDVYFTFWMDADIGNFADDYVGCDTAIGMGFAYNGNPADAGYGSNPPALGTMFLDGPLANNFTNFMYYENDFSPRGNPSNAQEFYNLQRSIWIDGTPLTEGGNGYGGTVPTNHMFPGDAGFCGGASNGWNEVSVGNTPFDRRYLQSIGPFDLGPDEIVKLDMAVIWAQGNDNLESVCLLKDAGANLRTWFSQQNNDCFSLVVGDGDFQQYPWKGVGGMVLFPNPTTGDVLLETEEALRQAGTVKIYDQIGRLVMEKEMSLGQQRLQLETNSLPNGVYVVRLKEADLVRTSKLVVSH